VSHAIGVGYRHIDTAAMYDNEEAVGEGIRDAGLDRDDIFLTTKVWHTDIADGDLQRSAEASLKRLGVDAVDLLLIHWPSDSIPLDESVKALNEVKQRGLTRHIGVSNFTIALLDDAVNVCPEPLVTNQIEYHAYIRQDRLIAACQRHGLLVTCHVPLARGTLLDDPVIVAVAAAHGKTAAQVALRWLVQQPDVAVVPRALNFREIEENIGLFDFTLSDDEMERIGTLRDKNIRIVDPEVRRPVWDEG